MQGGTSGAESPNSLSGTDAASRAKTAGTTQAVFHCILFSVPIQNTPWIMCTFLTSRPRRRAPDALGEGKPKNATYPAHAHRCRSAVSQTFLRLPPVPGPQRTILWMCPKGTTTTWQQHPPFCSTSLQCLPQSCRGVITTICTDGKTSAYGCRGTYQDHTALDSREGAGTQSPDHEPRLKPRPDRHRGHIHESSPSSVTSPNSRDTQVT